MAQRREVDPTSQKDQLVLTAAAIGLVLVVVGGGWVSMHLGYALDGRSAPASNPAQLAADIAKGITPWTASATRIAEALGGVLVVLFILVLIVIARSGHKAMRPDRAARHMAAGRDLAHLRARGARAKANRLGVVADSPGVPVGKAVRGGAMLFGSWEDMIVVVAGPRTQKTTGYAIPAVVAAPGAVLVTSNKRDVVDATRDVRARHGQVWIFDPQKVANESANWWWNPLTFIAPYDAATGRARRDPTTGQVQANEARAEKLAGQFVASSRPAGARTDAYFDGEAENLIGLLLLAAACGDERLTLVYTWLTQPTDETAVDLLKVNGFDLQEQSLYALSHLPDKQREGVYGTARSLMGFLRNRDIVSWISPSSLGERRQFHPHDFAASHDTLYPLSREGEGSAGPLIAALTVAVIDALVERATASPGGRLTVPFLAVLDEAANICRFRNLDSYYSHFGSRAIIIMTILQNWAQGEEVWGVKGMEKLWSAANIKIYGGGVDDDKFLRRISDLIGPFEQIVRSESVGRGSRQRSRSVQEKTILTVAELRELPPGRAIAFASGTPAVLIEPQPWFRGKDAAIIEASRKAHTPKAAPLVEAVPSVEAVPLVEAVPSGWNVRAIDD
jgi:type IV secretory pathway TraG/TraD family ATPase VirD4